MNSKTHPNTIDRLRTIAAQIEGMGDLIECQPDFPDQWVGSLLCEKAQQILGVVRALEEASGKNAVSPDKPPHAGTKFCKLME